MIKDNQKYFNRLQVILDGMVIVVSYLIAWYVMMVRVSEREVGVLPPEFYMMALVFVTPFLLVL